MADESTIKFDHEKHTDVMYVDFRETPKEARIRVVDVGEQTGFPGQIHLRVDIETECVYGLTIQNFSSFRRRMLLHYKMASVKRALEFFMQVLCAGLLINRDVRSHALTH